MSTCRRGIEYARIETAYGPLVVAGILVPGRDRDPSRRIKRELAANTVTEKNLQRWSDTIRDISASLYQANEAGGRDALSALHDVKTAVSAVMRATEQLGDSARRGAAIREDSNELVSLQKSVDFLSRRLRLMDIVANPESASIGKRRQVQFYKAVDRIVRTIEPLGAERRVRVRLKGESYSAITVFDSFDVIPLVLIDNAVKYAREGEEVLVAVTDSEDALTLSVESFSPVITDTERSLIFTRGQRGEAARLSADGSGIGLYVAQTVARAHGTLISVRAGAVKVAIGGVGYATNVFSVVFVKERAP